VQRTPVLILFAEIMQIKSTDWGTKRRDLRGSHMKQLAAVQRDHLLFGEMMRSL
jgi:hypothetical protein